MWQLRLENHDVCSSGLTQRAHRAAYCDILLTITPDNQAEALAAFRKTGALGPFRGLHISGIDDLSFLKEFPRLLYLELFPRKKGVNTRQLDSLENLRGLHLDSPAAGLDFACFPHLEVYSGDWHAEHRNLEQARELRRLRVHHFRSGDLAELSGITRLEDLMLVRSSIQSLAGLESMEDLRYLDIAYAPKLESLDVLSNFDCGLREIAIEKAKGIRSYSPLASIACLRRLKLSACAAMPNLKWTAGMNRLDFFSFVGTNVVDGNMSFLLELPNLRYVGMDDKRHYSIKFQALNHMLDQRHARPSTVQERVNQ